jgi:hypothetical protein
MVSNQPLVEKVRKFWIFSRITSEASNLKLFHTAEQGVGFKSIGKAVKKGTKHIGKTMTAISDSPDKRGQGMVGQVTAPQFYNRENRKDKRKQLHVTVEGSLGLDGRCLVLAVCSKYMRCIQSNSVSRGWRHWCCEWQSPLR